MAKFYKTYKIICATLIHWHNFRKTIYIPFYIWSCLSKNVLFLLIVLNNALYCSYFWPFTLLLIVLAPEHKKVISQQSIAYILLLFVILKGFVIYCIRWFSICFRTGKTLLVLYNIAQTECTGLLFEPVFIQPLMWKDMCFSHTEYKETENNWILGYPELCHNRLDCFGFVLNLVGVEQNWLLFCW